MPALDFPSSPITGATYTAPNGTIWVWDGAKWTNGVYIGTAYAPINAPVFTGDAQAVTPSPGDNDTSIATTAFVQGAQRYLNYADNSGFSVNQRTYVSGTALAAGIYGHDRWKAGAGGATYTFTASPPSTTITITAGTLQQVVEGASLAGGNYRLSWTGTAQGRVGAGSYASSPVAVSGATAGANLTIEFNTGTLAQVKFEAGTVPTPWQPNAARYELANCQRFYQNHSGVICAGYNAAGGTVYTDFSYPCTMRAVPTVAFSSQNYSNSSALSQNAVFVSHTQLQITVTAAGAAYAFATVTLTADL